VELNISIIHKHIDTTTGNVSGCEFQVPETNFRVDGIVSETNTLIEILGDFWHGNPSIYNMRDVNRVTQTTYGELLKKTFSRFDSISKQGYKVFYVWENDIKNFFNGSGDNERDAESRVEKIRFLLNTHK
jgi:G:T-mismatch repair DNA endonuclease (very short patch repair protein)